MTNNHGASRRASLILIQCFPPSLLLFHSHRSLPDPVRGYQLQSTNLPYFTLASLHFLSPPFFLPLTLPHFPRSQVPSRLSPLFLYMPIICQYSCAIWQRFILYFQIKLNQLVWENVRMITNFSTKRFKVLSQWQSFYVQDGGKNPLA